MTTGRAITIPDKFKESLVESKQQTHPRECKISLQKSVSLQGKLARDSKIYNANRPNLRSF
jgi:hypothetical protein